METVDSKMTANEEANGHQRLGEDAFGFMNILGHSLSARSVAVAHSCR